MQKGNPLENNPYLNQDYNSNSSNQDQETNMIKKQQIENKVSQNQSSQQDQQQLQQNQAQHEYVKEENTNQNKYAQQFPKLNENNQLQQQISNTVESENINNQQKQNEIKNSQINQNYQQNQQYQAIPQNRVQILQQQPQGQIQKIQTTVQNQPQYPSQRQQSPQQQYQVTKLIQNQDQQQPNQVNSQYPQEQQQIINNQPKQVFISQQRNQGIPQVINQQQTQNNNDKNLQKQPQQQVFQSGIQYAPLQVIEYKQQPQPQPQQLVQPQIIFYSQPLQQGAHYQTQQQYQNSQAQQNQSNLQTQQQKTQNIQHQQQPKDAQPLQQQQIQNSQLEVQAQHQTILQQEPQFVNQQQFNNQPFQQQKPNQNFAANQSTLYLNNNQLSQYPVKRNSLQPQHNINELSYFPKPYGHESSFLRDNVTLQQERNFDDIDDHILKMRKIGKNQDAYGLKEFDIRADRNDILYIIRRYSYSPTKNTLKLQDFGNIFTQNGKEPQLQRQIQNNQAYNFTVETKTLISDLFKALLNEESAYEDYKQKLFQKYSQELKSQNNQYTGQFDPKNTGDLEIRRIDLEQIYKEITQQDDLYGIINVNNLKTFLRGNGLYANLEEVNDTLFKINPQRLDPVKQQSLDYEGFWNEFQVALQQQQPQQNYQY
ncbi:hypothetical protein PPERSA_01565 [Pseudocohnilembus persalinus]|uniref:Uncharacterized protein n=1 Tax=Pseudocohnilembus persalinus TaxID=266149 RepID=A0A0V0QHH4_PSEPJ|nr:hypothetical protein PPERSA_01565 [Pseudocohnilembus persalinus]|eukprot:KRX01695.1 hypothetical protein PPERSA_01565 [Pseudocohnilembus persalinus]